MPLLSSTHQKSKRVLLTISMNESLLNEIKAYCEWANIHKPTDFFIQAIDYILKMIRNGASCGQVSQQNTKSFHMMNNKL